jgi:undecaprenyl phosphate-alpha-L-ara4FN deformylase
LTSSAPKTGNVFTLHAELEGMKLAPIFERLLEGWKTQGHELTTTRALFESLDLKKVPYHEVEMREIPGRSGALAVQGKPYLAV